VPTSQKHPAAVQFGNRLREERAARGWSQMTLAERAHLHFTYVASVERGERNISLVNILKLAKGLEVDPGDLLRGVTGGS
jgi:transcriptional regulator with XRE-family HTH domain